MLSLNAKKTEFIVFRPPISSKERVVLSLNGKKLYESTKLKYLGLMLDNKLNWKTHLNELAKKTESLNWPYCKNQTLLLETNLKVTIF